MPPVSNNHAAATNSVSEGSLGSSDTPATTPQSELANNLAASQNVSMTLSSTDTDKKTASKTGQLQRDLEGVGNLSTATTNLNEAAGHARFGSTALAKPNEQDGVKNNSQRPSSASSVAPTLRATGLIDPEIKVDSDSDRHLASSLTSATVEKLNREFNQLKNINWNGLNTPSNPSDLREGNIVSIQQHVISAALNSEGSLVLTSAEHGDGLWVPYLGSVQGTYTDKLDDSISWVATGPFSGCHAGVFSNDTDIRFAHLVTPDAGFASPPIARQHAEILSREHMQTGQNWKVPTTQPAVVNTKKSHGVKGLFNLCFPGAVKKKTEGDTLLGLGILFFFKIDGTWFKRCAWVDNGGGDAKVRHTDQESLPIQQN